MAGTIKTQNIQLGDSATASQNFVLSVPASPDGTVKLSRGNVGATTQDVLVVDATGNAQLTKTSAQSMVRLNTANGYGSINTAIRRFTNVVTNQGSDITYTDSATLGANLTINTAGVYAISYEDNGTLAADLAISLNSAELTTNAYQITPVSRLCGATFQGGNACGACASTVVYLPVGSVIRPHLNTGTTSYNAACANFTITRVA
jgi:hypothetical protein